jgi:hypothetical protein
MNEQTLIIEAYIFSIISEHQYPDGRIDEEGLTEATRSELCLGSSSDIELSIAKNHVVQSIRKWN